MPSSLTWVDHDQEARERSLRVLALFQEKESRDELGLGAIRDSFADQFFPGTTTIQTRLRYMLFVPWIYRALEEKKIPPEDFGVKAERKEQEMMRPLIESDDQSGAFGRLAGDRLKRLPSSVYWAGLGSWRIRLIDQSQDQYHRCIGDIYRRREAQEYHRGERERIQDDRAGEAEPGTITWHLKLPLPPEGFPANLSFSLTKEEAEFLLDRIQCTHPESLLAHLALHCKPAVADAPWLHPDWASFRDSHKELLEHARMFSYVMHGAAIVYNITLAELRNWEEKTAEHREALHEWTSGLDYADLEKWSLPRLWELVSGKGHAITPASRRFVEAWIAIARQRPSDLADDAEARALVKHREMVLKGEHSRYRNHRALEQWSGYAGLGRLIYRWPRAQVFLEDLYKGLHRESHAESK